MHFLLAVWAGFIFVSLGMIIKQTNAIEIIGTKKKFCL